MENKKIIQPLTAEIMDEADKESAKEMAYVKEHMEELRNMTWEERWDVLKKIRASEDGMRYEGDRKVLQPLTAEIMEEADERTSRQMEYYSTHKEELRNMTEEEFFRAMMKAAKEDEGCADLKSDEEL